MKNANRRGDFAMVSEKVRRQLYEAVAAHKADLEVERGFTSLELNELDRRIEASQQLLEHLLRPRSRAPSNVVFADFLSRSVGGAGGGPPTKPPLAPKIVAAARKQNFATLS
jgi:hypothetical protein